MRKDLILPFYLPSFLLAVASGMLTPVLPLYLKSFGVSFGMVSVAVSALGVGLILSDLPIGSVIHQLGQRRAMLIGLGVLILAMVAIAFARGFYEIILYRLMVGAGMAMWQIARHAYIARVTAVAERGRSLSIFGGVGRTGSFVGPALGGLIAARWGLRAPFLVHAFIAMLAAILVFCCIKDSDPAPLMQKGAPRFQLLRVLRRHIRVLLTAGSAQMFAQMIRAGRRLIVPLYGAYQLGLDEKTIGLIISAAAAIDTLMFLPAGLIMDRAGRKYASVPCFLILGFGMGLIPFAHSAWGFVLATLLMGFGNGLGSGAMMTLGADLAPKKHLSEFLAGWRLIGDAGNTGGPLVVGAVADLIGLAASAWALSGVGLIAAMMLFFYVPETLRHDEPRGMA